MTSIAYVNGFYYVPRIDRKVVQQYKEDLKVLTGNTYGEIASKILLVILEIENGLNNSDGSIISLINFKSEAITLQLLFIDSINGRPKLSFKEGKIRKLERLYRVYKSFWLNTPWFMIFKFFGAILLL